MKSLGFSILELLITLSVIVVLGAIAVPCYQNYEKRVYYKEIVQAAAPYKENIAKCYEHLSNFKNCDGGMHHIPANQAVPKGGVASIQVTDGVITVIPVATNGITMEDNYILTPTMVNKELKWIASGKGAARYTDSL